MAPSLGAAPVGWVSRLPPADPPDDEVQRRILIFFEERDAFW